MDYHVERRPGDGLQWVRPIQRRRRRERDVTFERRRRIRRVLPDLAIIDNDLPPRPPPFEEIERLLATYVATGGGTGAYLAALESQQSEYISHEELDERYVHRNTFPRRSSHRLSESSSSSDSGHGHGGRPPLRPSGGPPDRPSGDYVVEVDIAGDEEDVRPPHHAYVEEVSEDEDEPIYADLPPEENDRRTSSMRTELRRTQSTRTRAARERSPAIRDEPRVVHIEPVNLDNPRRSVQRHSVRAEHGPNVQSSGVEEERVIRHDREIHVQRPEPQRHVIIEVPDPEPQINVERQEQVLRAENEAHRRGINHSASIRRRRGALRGGELRPEEVYELQSSDDDQTYVNSSGNISQNDHYQLHSLESRNFIRPRLRGGGPTRQTPTRNQALVAGTLEPDAPIDISPRRIYLSFFCTIRGKIVSSHTHEIYTTFQNLPQNPVISPAQLSDQWVIDMLQKHYRSINRRKEGYIWDLISFKTIGFANFIRFERTVRATQDPNGYVVSAKIPFISAEGDATSQFRYLMRYPLERDKMILFKLDRLVATTISTRPSFYVVEIKEAPDTSKIYILLALLILVSTGGGTVYAVVNGDVGTGLSISSYVLTCLSLILALLSVGQWLGLSKPDSFSFAYDIQENQIIGATHIQQAFLPSRGYLSQT